MSGKYKMIAKGKKKVIKDPRLSSRQTLLLCFILYPFHVPLPVFYKLNGFNQFILEEPIP